ncbi:hypothetical protein [Tardiphaga sp. 813_E8_N1_3]|uniref:hypothetical protein n=1 Tax=Tardiphaga sp. 813_E8_N1_3 TaxID=3240760 RepID=UPI003F22C271
MRALNAGVVALNRPQRRHKIAAAQRGYLGTEKRDQVRVSTEPKALLLRLKMNKSKSVAALSQSANIDVATPAVKQPNCRHVVFRWSLRNTGDQP